MSELRGIWQNAWVALADPKKRHWRKDARILIAAIQAEWTKRAHEPPADGDYFPWPTTEASGGDRSVSGSAWLLEGPLSFHGYHVGVTSDLTTPIRRAILSGVFLGPVPPVFPVSHMIEWGLPSSASRLRKMAESIAAFTRNARRRRNRNLDFAIKDWEDDLNYLYEEYYIGRFHFAWPSGTL